MKTNPSNKKFHSRGIARWAIFICIVFASFLGACAQKNSEQPDASALKKGQPVSVDPKSLQPGLTVLYAEGFWRHVHQMPKIEEFINNQWSGKPITKIDHRFEKNEVFDSGKSRGIGVQMTGLIHIEQPGHWEFKVRSNDGIDIKIAQIQVVFDPQWHSDRFSKPMGFTADKPGWYPILLRYFQRKGTATLEFYWKAPGASEFSIIPENAYWHAADPSK